MAPMEKPLVVLAGPIHPDAKALLETETRVTVSRHETEDGLVNDAREAEPAALDQLLARSDVVTVHTPHTPETHHIISADAVAKMKPGVVFVNTCRGKTQDERALFEGLTKGKIRAAGLDVWEEEPIPVDNPLLNLENVVCTSHIAGVSEEAHRNIGLQVAGEMLRVLRGEKPKVLANPDLWPKLGHLR